MHIDQLTHALSLITKEDHRLHLGEALRWLQSAIKGHTPSRPAVSRSEAMKAAQSYLNKNALEGVYTPISSHVGLKTLPDNYAVAAIEANKQVMARNRLQPVGVKVPQVYGIIRTYNTYLSTYTIVLVMEHIEGELFSYRYERNLYPQSRFQPLLEELTRAAGAFHNDIHDENIVVALDGYIALIDWAITDQGGRFRRWAKIGWGREHRNRPTYIAWGEAHRNKEIQSWTHGTG